MFSDPEPIDEDDPEAMEEVFEVYEAFGKTPESLKSATEKERKEYAAWLLKETLV
jgi:hypothetical protein